MKIGIISDAHGNACALSKCLEPLSRLNVEEIIFLGDSVGYFPEPEEVLTKLDSVNAFCLMGNHEAMLLGISKLDKIQDEVYRIGECRISEKQLGRMRQWLPYCERMVEGRRLLFVHGSPWHPLDGYVYPDSDLKIFANLRFDAVFMGHTHLPFASRIGNMLVANVGSCGLPRERNTLSYAVYDTGKGSYEIMRVSFDTQEIVRRYGHNISKVLVEHILRNQELP
jgi:putative phosphoesterase